MSLEEGIFSLWMPEIKQIFIYYETHKIEKLYSFFELISLIEDLKNERYMHDFYFYDERRSLVCGGCSEIDIKDNNILRLKSNEKEYFIYPEDLGSIYNCSGEKQEQFSCISIFEGESNLYDSIARIINTIVMPTQALKEFVNNDYKSPEDLKHDEIVKYSELGVVLV